MRNNVGAKQPDKMGKSQLRAEDLHKRICFLYQAAQESLKSSPKDVSMCRYYVTSLQVIARKNLIPLHPDLKRTLCKRCCCVLVPGVTSIVRVKKKRQKQTVITCLECGTLRRFMNNPHRIPWVDRTDSWEDVVIDGIHVACHKGNKKQGKPKQTANVQQKKGNNSNNKNSSDKT